LELVDGADAHVGKLLSQRGHLGVVGSHDHQISARERTLVAVLVTPKDRAARELRDDCRDDRDVLGRARLIAVVLYGHVHEPGRAEVRDFAVGCSQHGLAFEPGVRAQPILIEHLGRERANRWMQSPRLVQKQTAIRWDGFRLAQNVLERRRLRARRVARLLWLLELLRIAEQHEVLRARGYREHVGQRHLACLIDEQHVDALPKIGSRPEPRRAAEQPIGAAREQRRDPIVVVDRVQRGGVLVLRFALVQTLKILEPLLGRALAHGA
jgi:hypothetical protein